MKKFLLVILAVMIVFGGFAYAVDIPSPGVSKTMLDSNQQAGAKYWEGAREFRLIRNRGTATGFNGCPAFYKVTTGGTECANSVAYTNMGRDFAGVWYCDTTGNPNVSAETQGWIQTYGTTRGYVTGRGNDGQARAIVAGDKIIPFEATQGTQNTVFGMYEFGGGTTAEGLASLASLPIALDAVSSGTATGETIRIWLRGRQ